jgi:hypothetical protein
MKVYQEAMKNDWINDDYYDVLTITTESEPFKTEKRAPNQDMLSSLVKQVQENVKLTPSGKERIISLIRQYEHWFATHTQHLQGRLPHWL